MVASSSGRSPRHWPDFSSVSTRSLFPAPESRAARRCHGLGRLRHRRWGHTKSGWLFTTGLVLHGWLPTALDVFFYGYLCWLGFWFIRGTKGPEGVFMVGWSAGVLLSPLAALRPQWAVAIRHLGAFGLAVALLASLSLLLEPMAAK